MNDGIKEIMSMLAGMTDEQLKEIAKRIKEEVYDHCRNVCLANPGE